MSAPYATNALRTPLALEANSAATRTSEAFINPYARSALFVVTAAAEAGTATATLALQAQKSDDTWHTIFTAAAAISANGTYTYYLTDGPAGTATYTESKILHMPAVWRITLTGMSPGNTFTTTVDCELYP